MFIEAIITSTYSRNISRKRENLYRAKATEGRVQAKAVGELSKVESKTLDSACPVWGTSGQVTYIHPLRGARSKQQPTPEPSSPLLFHPAETCISARSRARLQQLLYRTMARLSTFCENLFCCCRPKRSNDRSPTKRHARQVLSQHKNELRNQEEKGHGSDLNSSAFHERARQISAIPVSGMKRTADPGNMGYVTSYQTTQAPNPSSSSGAGPSVTKDGERNQNYDGSTNGDATLVGYGVEVDKLHGGELKTGSTWQGKPNGTVYDKRQELSEEDEDMWARLAM